MADEPQARADRWLYGSALVVAVVAGTVAVWNAWTADEGPEPPPPARPTEAEEGPSEEPPPGAVVFSDGGMERSARVGPDFEPALPEVPDLASEPPTPPEHHDNDPRMEQLGAEMRILSRARDLLAEHPSEALAVLRSHRRRHPDGVLREEREAFAIEALLMLEHVDEAERRYYDFLTDYPDSAFRERLREAMQRPPHEVGATGR